MRILLLNIALWACFASPFVLILVLRSPRVASIPWIKAGRALDDRIQARLDRGSRTLEHMMGGLLIMALMLGGLFVGLVVILAVIKWAFGVVF